MSRAAVALLLAALLLPLALSAQEVPPDFDEGVFQLSTPRTVQEPLALLTLVSPEGEVYLPLLSVLDYLGIPAHSTESGLELEWPPPAWNTRLRLPTAGVERPDQSFRLESGSLLLREDEWFIAIPALQRLLEVQAEVFWETLTIRLTAPDAFPIERQQSVEARRRRVAVPELDPEVIPTPYASRTGGAGLDWGAFGTLSGRSQTLGGSAAVGFGLLGGALEGGGSALLQDGEVELGGDPFVRFGRNFPGNRLLQQLELGHVRSEGPLPLQLFGLRLTNEPFVQPRLLGSVVVQPVLPTGWEYEVYEGGQLVGVGTAEPGGAVEAPMRYGTTPLTVRMIGPAGQERTEEMILLMPVTRVPPGNLRYYAAMGDCASRVCDRYGAGELRMGVSSRLTVGAGMDALWGSRADGLRPHLAVSASPFWNLSTELQARPGFVNASLHRLGGQRSSYSGRFLWSGESHPLGSAAGYRLDLSGQQALPRALGGRWISARLNVMADSVREVTSVQGSLSTPIRRGFLSVQHEAGLQQGRLTTVRLFRSLPAARGVSPLGLSGSASLQGTRIAVLEAGAALVVSQRTHANAQFQWRPGERPLVALGYSARFGSALAQLRGSALRGTPTVTGSLRGGLGFGPSGVVTTPFSAVGRAGITGRVFLDRDGTGAYTEGVDEPLEGVEIRATGRRMLTDAEGIYRGWDLQPYSAVVVAVDTLQLPDPGFAPLSPFQLLRPSPNMFNRVDIPLMRTREMMGTLARGEGVPTVGGVAVEIVNRQSGEITVTRTFSDGEFYVSRLLPGEYDVRVAETSLQALNAASQPGVLTVRVPAAGDGMGVTLPPIRVERRDAEDGVVTERLAVAPREEAAPPPPPVEPPARDQPAEPVEIPAELAPPDPAPELLGVPAQEGVREPLGEPVPPLHATRLRGTVRDTTTGLPMAARILAVPADGGPAIEAAADPESGVFSLFLLPGTRYVVQVTAPGYTPESVAIDLTGAAGGGLLTADVGLAALPVPPPAGPAGLVVRLDGTIRDTDTGSPLAARVFAFAEVGGQVAEVVSDDTTGRFGLDLPAGARYTLHISAPGYHPEQATLDLTGRLTTDRLVVNAGLRRLP